MAENQKFLLDVRTARLSKEGGRDVISDAQGHRYALTPISRTEPLTDVRRVLGKIVIQKIPGRNANIYKVANDRGLITAVKEVTLEHCKRGAPEPDGSDGTKRSWKPLSLPEREHMASQRIQAVSKEHPGLLKYFGAPVEDEDGTIRLEREWAEGESLEALLKNGALTRLQLLDVMSQVLDALSCMHSAGVVHRDVKPSNIIVDLKDAKVRGVKLIDLGAAYMQDVKEDRDTCTQMTTCFFSPGFAPMDALTGPCEQTDLFCVGATLLYALTGQDAFDIHDRGADRYVIPKDVKGPLRKILENSLQAATDRRYASCEEMSKYLRIAIMEETAQDCGIRLAKAKEIQRKREFFYYSLETKVNRASENSFMLAKGTLFGTMVGIPMGLMTLILGPTVFKITGCIVGAVAATCIGSGVFSWLVKGGHYLIQPISELDLGLKERKVRLLKNAVEIERARLKREHEMRLLSSGHELGL